MCTKIPHKQGQRNDTNAQLGGLDVAASHCPFCSSKFRYRLAGTLQTSKGHLLGEKKKNCKVSKNGMNLEKSEVKVH